MFSKAQPWKTFFTVLRIKCDFSMAPYMYNHCNKELMLNLSRKVFTKNSYTFWQLKLTYEMKLKLSVKMLNL